jgi:hypothetical protein
VALEAVQLLRLPGRHVALVSRLTAELGERLGELRRLDAEHYADAEPERPTRHAAGMP